MRLSLVAALMHRLLLLLVLAGGLAPSVFAQSITTTSGVAVFRYAEPGQPTTAVRLWGAVRSPGIYQVERGTDLLTVLTLAGGPAVSVEDDRSVRDVTVRVVRDPSAARTIVLETELDALTAENMELPGLEDGDLITLTARTRQRFTWRDALSITTSIAALAVLVLRIVE